MTFPRIPSSFKKPHLPFQDQESLEAEKIKKSVIKSEIQALATGSIPLVTRHVQQPGRSIDQVPLTAADVKSLGIPPAVTLNIKVKSDGKDGIAYGSGFPIHPHFVVTARHCIANHDGQPILKFTEINLPAGLWSDEKQTRIPIRYHLFVADGSVISVNLRDEQGNLKVDIRDERLQSIPLGRDFNTNGIPDIALIEFEEPFDMDNAVIPPLLSEGTISSLLSSPVPKRVLGFPLAKVKQDHKGNNEVINRIKEHSPLHLSCMGVNKRYEPTKLNPVYYHQSNGIDIYGGNSGGPIVSLCDGKHYYTGVAVAGNGIDHTIIPLKGNVMDELILPTLNTFNNTNNQSSVDLKAISIDDENIEKLSFFLDRFTNWLYSILPDLAQDTIFNWRIEKAIEEKNFTSFLKIIRLHLQLTDTELLDLKWGDVSVADYFGLASADDFEANTDSEGL